MRILLLAVSVSFAAAVPAADNLSLTQGNYRLAGRCSAMLDAGRDEISKCTGIALIMAKVPSRPNFAFARAGGEIWIFQAAGDAQRSSDGNTATYAVSRFLDGTKGAYELPGECVLQAKGQPTISCAIWQKGGRKEKEVAFNGNGNWSFSRE